MIMSRKNKNGGRRNYSPKTYSRDFLRPTPIERAIQEANKPASPQAVAVSDRIACDDKCSYEYKRMPAAWLETDFSYQRKIDSARVDGETPPSKNCPPHVSAADFVIQFLGQGDQFVRLVAGLLRGAAGDEVRGENVGAGLRLFGVERVGGAFADLLGRAAEPVGGVAHGSIFKTPSGYVQQVPQVSIAQQNLKIMQSFATEFGLTPACRARIVASGGTAESDDDPMAQLLKGGWQDDV